MCALVTGVQTCVLPISVAIDERLATEIARSAYHHEAPVRQVTFLQEPKLEARDFSGSMWRVDFANEDNSSSYVSAATGQPLVDRTDTWPRSEEHTSELQSLTRISYAGFSLQDKTTPSCKHKPYTHHAIPTHTLNYT